jgi:hypothetical protein
MLALSPQARRGVCAIAGLGVFFALLAPMPTARGQPAGPTRQPQGSVARLAVRITSSPTAPTVSGVLVAFDTSGQAIVDLDPRVLQATLDGRPVELALLNGRPSIALAAAFLLDSSASPQVRDVLANALAEGVQGLDVNRDTVAIVSTADPTTRPWDEASFSTSADDLRTTLNQVIQTDPNDGMVSLEQVSGALRALSAQPRDARVLLLFTNRPLAGAATAAATLGTIRTFAVDNGIQIGIVALPGAGGQGVAESLVEATPGGRVEYALNATNLADISRRVGLVLGPAFGARRFEFPAPADEGSHVLSVGAPGVALQATQKFAVAGRPVTVDALVIGGGTLKAGRAIKQPVWVQVRPAAAGPIDSVEWSVDGRVTQVTNEPWALLLDPEQLGDGRHELSARIISQGRAGPFLTTDVSVPAEFLRSVRNLVRAWGLIAVLLMANIGVGLLFLRLGLPGFRTGLGGGSVEFPPSLRLNQLGGRYVAPEVLHFPARGKLRIGYHPPYMDNQVGSREFARLPFQDVRGDEDAVKDLSRHVGCIWRDPKTNDCFVQLGWPGPGEPLDPKPQSQVFHLGRPQDATSGPFRLAHHDVLRLASGIEFVFYQVGLRDKATPESKKLGPFLGRAAAPPTLLTEERRRHAQPPEPTAEDG